MASCRDMIIQFVHHHAVDVGNYTGLLSHRHTVALLVDFCAGAGVRENSELVSSTLLTPGPQSETPCPRPSLGNP